MYSSLYTPAICKNMDGPRDYHTTWSKPDRERQGILKKKKRYKWIYVQNKNRSTDTENKLTVTKGKGGNRGVSD